MDDQIYFCAITSKFPGCFAANLFTLANWQSCASACSPGKVVCGATAASSLICFLASGQVGAADQGFTIYLLMATKQEEESGHGPKKLPPPPPSPPVRLISNSHRRGLRCWSSGWN